MKMKVYIAGPYSAESHMAIFDNIRAGLQAAKDLMLAGYSPYCPFVDFLYSLMLYNMECLRIDDYYECSMEWLKVSDAIVVLDGWEKSKGVLKEIEVAKTMGIPICYSLEELINKKWEVSP